jgi:hypothetical protein
MGAYKAPEQRADESPAQWAIRVLNDTSHHILITDDNIDEWLLLDCYRDKPWTLLTPRGPFEARQLCAWWNVPSADHSTVDVFHLHKIIWHSDADGWVAEYVERR